MRYHTKEYYTLLMGLGAADLYEPIIDKDYTDEEIEELYQNALDDYVEDERSDHDTPPEYIDDEDELFALSVLEFENRGPFDEEEAIEEFEELYRDNLEEPDEDLPEWVLEKVDRRILAMYLMPEKTYEKLVAEDAENEERFDKLDEEADDAIEALMETLPEEYSDFMELLEELEDATIIAAEIGKDSIRIEAADWDAEAEELAVLEFGGTEVLENEGVEVSAWKDEDGDDDSDCELLYSELYLEDGRPEIHMMFDNNGLRYLTFRCSEARAVRRDGREAGSIKG